MQALLCREGITPLDGAPLLPPTCKKCYFDDGPGIKLLTTASPSYLGCEAVNGAGVSQSGRLSCIAVLVTRGVVGGVGCGVGLGVGFTSTNLGGSEGRAGVESASSPAFNNGNGD